MSTWLRDTTRTLAEFLFPSRVEQHSIPTMEGSLMPNDLVDEFNTVWRRSGQQGPPDALYVLEDHLFIGAGSELIDIDLRDGSTTWTITLDHPVATITSHHGTLLLALTTGLIVAIDPTTGAAATTHPVIDTNLTCLTDATVVGDTLYLSQGSEEHTPRSWRYDFMAQGGTGALHQIDLNDGTGHKILGGLQWAGGVVPGHSPGEVLFTEAWRSNIMRLDTSTGNVEIHTDRELPGYPTRLHHLPTGHLLASIPLMRTHLVDLVLRDEQFKSRMIDEVAPEFWICPDLERKGTPWEPLQLGTVKHLGVTKPWAPPLVYGLAVMFDGNGVATRSWHARAGSLRSGVTCVASYGDELIIAAYGTREVLRSAQLPEVTHDV